MESLVGQKITAYMDGGWKLGGNITSMSGNMIVVTNNKKEYVLFKDKISFMRIGVLESDLNKEVGYKEEKKDYGQYNEMPFSLPSNLLNSDYSDEDHDLSVNFGSSNNGSKISFKLKDEGGEP